MIAYIHIIKSQMITDIENPLASIDVNDLDTFIVLNVMESEEPIKFLDICFNQNHNHVDIIINYIYIVYTNELKDTHREKLYSWLLDNGGNEIGFLQMLLKKIEVHEKNEGVDNFLKYIYDHQNRHKYKLIKQLFIKDFELCQKKIQKNGFLEETIGMFSWIKPCALEHDLNEIMSVITVMIDSSDKEKNRVLITLNHILDLNKAYTFQDVSNIMRNRCSGFEFLHIISRILLNLWKKYGDQSMEYSIPFPRDDYTIYTSELKNSTQEKEDNIQTLLYILTCKTFSYCIISQMRIFHMNTKYFNQTKQKLLKQIFNDVEYHNQILEFLNHVSTNKLFMNDSFISSFIDYVFKKKKLYSLNILNQHIYDYILDVIKGNYSKNPFLRIHTISNFLRTFKLSDIKSMNIRDTNLLQSFLMFIDSIDCVQIMEKSKEGFECHDMIMNMIILIMHNDVCESEIEKELRYKCIYKITRSTLEFTDTLISKSKNIINEVPYYLDLDLNQISRIKSIDGKSIKYHADTITTSLECIEMLSLDSKEFRLELIVPIVTAIVELLKYFSKSSDPMIFIYGLSQETGLILLRLFLIIHKLKNNIEFGNNIYEQLEMIIEILPRVYMLGDQVKTELLKYFEELEIKIKNTPELDDAEYPEEFIDPIMLIPIKNPVMIPNIKSFFDKSSIMSHLYHEYTNPYTREKLTIDELNEYNKKDEVIEQISEFNTRYEDWKCLKKK